MSLFKKAADKAKDNPTKGGGKQRAIVTINDPAFHENAKRLVTLRREIEDRNTEANVLAADVKEASIAEFNKLYEKNKKYPGSFEIQAIGKAGEQPVEWTFVPTDAYIKPDKEQQEKLKEEFGDDIIDERTTYEMDKDMIDKYGDILSDLIEKCKKIPDADKEKIIKAVIKPAVTKGTITVLLEKYGKIPLAKAVEKLKPIFQVKDLHITE